jgi:hypothetical protein
MNPRTRPHADGHIGTGELAARARVTVRQIQHWTTLGFLHADERPGLARQGSFLTYGPDATRIALVLAALVHNGVEPRAAADAARHAVVLDDGPPLPPAFGTLLGGLTVFGRLP